MNLNCQIPKTRIWHCHVQIIRLSEIGRNAPASVWDRIRLNIERACDSQIKTVKCGDLTPGTQLIVVYPV